MLDLKFVTFGIKFLYLCGVGLRWLYLDLEPRNICIISVPNIYFYGAWFDLWGQGNQFPMDVTLDVSDFSVRPCGPDRVWR